MQSLNVTVVWNEYSTQLQLIFTVKMNKGRIETLTSSTKNQNGNLKSDLVGWVKVKIQSHLHVGGPILFL